MPAAIVQSAVSVELAAIAAAQVWELAAALEQRNATAIVFTPSGAVVRATPPCSVEIALARVKVVASVLVVAH